MKTFVKVLTCVAFLFFSSNNSYAQAQAEAFTNKNAVYLEALGNGGVVSVNYDRIFYSKSFLKLSSRIGFGVLPVLKIRESHVYEINETNRKINPTLVTEVTGMLGRSNHNLEIGLGYTYRNYTEPGFERVTVGTAIPIKVNYRTSQDHYIFSRVGYRYQKPTGGFLFRAGFTPVLLSLKTYHRTSFFELNAGLSFGWSF
ncbi:hypothetical protein [Botryobacter ruber]|uniref:hypothetical protein n=1 Tax=Botryobacter ruber TaxID=2171629 RepID=UPI000F655078|nr:hypothetical protein [Botryobacter ruber]